ncbi:MAG: VWA domain-containing protein, partial [Pseudomonadota bacterium]
MSRFVTRCHQSACAAALLAASALSAPTAAADAPTRQAVDLVNSFIAEQQRRFRSGAPSILSDPATSRLYLEDALADALSEAALGFDPVFDAQDADIANVRVSRAPEAPVLQGAIQIVATFTNFGAPQRLDYTLVQRSPGEPFQISTIYSPRHGWSLSRLVDVPRPGPGAPELTLYDAASPARGAAPAADRAELLFILDGSGSMWGQVDGVAKIATAKEALKGLAADLSETMNVGLMAYGHRREGDCGDISVILPSGAHEPAAMSRAVDGVVPRGKTPIADALSQAATAFSGDRASNVLLVSDGLETCNGDPCAAAAALAARGIDTRVHVVGFDLSREEAAALACIAREGNGLYLTASNAAELNQALVRVADEARAVPPAPEPEAITSDVVFEETFDGPLDPSWRVENAEPSLAGLVPGGELFASAVGRTIYFAADATNRFVLDQP